MRVARLPSRGSRRSLSTRIGLVVVIVAVISTLGWMLSPRTKQSEGYSSPAPNRLAADAGSGSSGAIAFTFNKDIAPLMYDHCSPCHRPDEAAPFGLLTFEDVHKRVEQIIDVTDSRYMPPWKPEPGYAEFVGDRRLSDQQIEMLRLWFDAGAPEGNPEDLRPPPRFPVDWQLGKPDMVFRLPEPYTLPPDGTDAFRNFVIPAPVSTTRYVRAVELRPGNSRIAHHGLIKIDRTSTSRRHDALDPGPGYEGMRMLGAQDPDGQFIVWTPGTAPDIEPEDMAWRLERGTDLVLQLHMQPTGKPESIQPTIGLYFTDQPPTRTATVLQLYSSEIDVPPGVKNYTVEDAFVLPVEVEVLGIFPHAHYIGKEMKAYAELPEGGRRWLLHIKDWDFNWQDDFRYVQPVQLPAGAKLVMHYTYDNSADNPRNPSSPPKRVVAGDKSTDEMGSLTLRLLTKDDQDRWKLDESMARVQLRRSLGRDADAHYALATALQSQGRFDEAVNHYRSALVIKPKHAPTHCNLGVLLKLRGNLNEAVRHYREAIFIDPEFADAHTNLGNALTQMGRFEDAVRHYQRALSIQPDSVGAHYNLAYLFQRIGRSKEALPHYRDAIRLRPDYAAAYNHLAWILATHKETRVRNGAEAVRLAEIACRLTDSKHHVPLNTLAAACAEAGNFDKAIVTAQLALDRAVLTGKTPVVEPIRDHLQLYRAKQPLREAQ